MAIKNVKKDEIVVKADDFGFLVEEFVQRFLRRQGPSWDGDWVDKRIREWWPMIEGYYQRHIMTAIEVSIALDDPPRGNREPLEHRSMWEKIVKDLRPPRSAFTVDYRCSKCKAEGIKLWRDYNTCADYIELKCAVCLAPEEKVDDQGKVNYKDFGKTDQLKGHVPAIPVDDTYWGYTSVPSQDVEWWIALPTYKSL